MTTTNYSKYTFRDHTGYIVAPWLPGATHELVSIRHTASVPLWTDHAVHIHTASEEYYFMFQGELRLLVDASTLTLKAREALMVKPHVPHAVLGGSGPIELFVLRMPAPDDRQVVGQIPAGPFVVVDKAERALQSDWGYRVPLAETRYQNCWLFGVRVAPFHSDYICLVYLNFPADESADADIQSHPHRLHLHERSWEYYTALKGTKILRVEQELVEINAGETLAVPPGVKHVLHAIHTPFEGITFRVPRLDDKVEF